MKKVLFVIEKFYPKNTAILNCLEPIFAEMKSNNIEIDVMTYRQDMEDSVFEIINGINVIRVNDYYNLIKSSILKKTVLRLTRKLFLKSKMIHVGKKLLKKNKYDCIIACSYPFLMEEITYKICKNTKCTFISYQFDPFYNNMILDKDKQAERLKLELKVLKNADRIFLPHENYEENLLTELKVLKKKYYPLDFALIKEKKISPNKSSLSTINFVFTGTFYKDIRTPYFMLDFVKNIHFDYHIDLYYISDETINNELLNYQRLFNGKLSLYRNKSKEECDKALEKANIIINVGNLIANQTPSKVFEYISLGKPILNFYTNKNDTSKKVLKNYPLVLNVFKDYDEEDILNFIEFCKENKNKILDFKEATKNYKTASEIAKEFVREVSDCCANKQNKE